MIEGLAYIAAAAFAVLMGRRIIGYARRALVLRAEGMGRRQHRTPLEAAVRATRLVQEAEETVELYADFGAEVYNHDAFIAAIGGQLVNPSFRVYVCYHSAEPPSKFMQCFAGHDQVRLRRLKDEERPRPIHYIAIDGWLEGVLTDGVRYRDFSYRNYPPKAAPLAQAVLRGKYKQPLAQYEPL